MIGYVARDKNGLIFLHKDKPELDKKLEGWFSNDFFELSDEMFPELTTLTYENSPLKDTFQVKVKEVKYMYEGKEHTDYEAYVELIGINKNTGKNVHYISAQTGL